MFLRRHKRKFTLPTTLTYNWVGTIDWGKIYRVYRAENVRNLRDNQSVLAVVFKLTSENSKDGYVLIENENDPISEYWHYSAPEDILIKLKNVFLPKYDKK
jgi:hypothetical protein